MLQVKGFVLTPSRFADNVAGPSRPQLVHSPQFSPAAKAKPLSPDTSLIPGETEEDGALRREYVLVGDKQAVEINRAVDGMRAWEFCRTYVLMAPLQRSPLVGDHCATANRPRYLMMWRVRVQNLLYMTCPPQITMRIRRSRHRPT